MGMFGVGRMQKKMHMYLISRWFMQIFEINLHNIWRDCIVNVNLFFLLCEQCLMIATLWKR